MVEVGGRAGWARVASLSVFLSGGAALGVSACGGRTSEIDPNVYGPGPTEATAGRTSQGGSASTRGGDSSASAGTSTTVGGSTAIAGAGSSVDPNLTEATCQKYCAGYGTECKQRLEGKNCLTTCRGELNGFGDYCQRLGVAALQCLTPFFSATGRDCTAAVNRALTRCEATVTKFTECKTNVSINGSSVPPRSVITTCPHMGTASGTDCVEIFDCADTTYITQCFADGNALTCTCVASGKPIGEGKLARSMTACIDATALCR